MWGLENSNHNTYTKKTITARLARHSYGICCGKPFDSSKGHLQIDRKLYPDGHYRAINQMQWLLHKVGDDCYSYAAMLGIISNQSVAGRTG